MITLKQSPVLPGDNSTLARRIVLRYDPDNGLHPFSTHTAFQNPETKDWAHSWGNYFEEYFTANADYKERVSKLR